MEMVKEDIRPIANTAKRLPIVFCLDVSPSMTWDDNGYVAIDLLNSAVASFISDLCENSKAKASAEVAFVSFSTNIELDTDFTAVRKYENKPPVFSSVDRGGTQMAKAVLHSIDKMNRRIEEYKKMQLKYYEPFLVIITDGRDNDIPELRDQAIQTVNNYCAEDKLIPFVIGVGDDVDPQILNQYAHGSTDGYFPVLGKDVTKKFADAIKIVSMSAIISAKSKTTSSTKTKLGDFYDEFINT